MQKGKLKIFFGYSAGVGKTYAMLKAAQDLKSLGIDVVIGYLEPHDRPETLKMAEGLERLPLKELSHGGILLKEFDVDAALARRPQLLLVDELAHTNAAGSKNRKRYLDVEEVINSGIDVYTTVNVQHIEGLHDTVDSATSVDVNERIPDEIFDYADELALIDIEPTDLIERMKEGKIYKKNRSRPSRWKTFSARIICLPCANCPCAVRRTGSKSKPITDGSRRKCSCLSVPPLPPQKISAWRRAWRRPTIAGIPPCMWKRAAR